MATTQELIFKITADNANLKATMAQVRAELGRTTAATKATTQGELSMSQQLAAAASLDKQRMAQRLRDFTKQETALHRQAEAAKRAAAGFVPLSTNLQKITDIMGGLRASTAVMEGPLGGIAGRLGSVSTLAANAGGALTKMLAAMGPVGIAAAGTAVQVAAAGIALVVVAKAATGVVNAFFELSKSAAGFRGELFDLSQQTGVEVETLNALEIVASKTGGSIDSIAQSLVIFQGKLDEAQDSSSKAGQKFDELGISTGNTEDAFRDALMALAAMPKGFHQTNEAAELFGRRGGKQVLAILKETNGDIDSAVSLLGDLAKVTKEDAKLADDFNDVLKDFHIIWRGIGKEAIPPALAVLKDFFKLLKDNQVLIDAVGTSIKLFGLGIKGGFVDPVVLALKTLAPVLERVTKIYERLAKAAETLSGRLPAVSIPGMTAVPLSGVSGRRDVSLADATKEAADATKHAADAVDAAEKAAQARLKHALARSEDAAKVELELERRLREGLRLEFEQRNSDLEEHYKREQQLIDLHLATLKEQIAAERIAIQAGLEQNAIDQEEFANRKRDLDLRATQAQSKRNEETARLDLERRQKLDAQEIELRERNAAISETVRKGELDRLKVALERHAIDESDLITKQLEFLKQVHKERIGIIDFEIKSLSTSTERKKELDAEKKKSEQEYTDAFKALTHERIDAMNREAAQRAPGVSGEPINPDDVGRQAGAAADAIAGLPPVIRDTTNIFGELGREISNVFGLGKEGAEIFGGLLTNAFGSLAHAVGEAVHAFVLFGGAGMGIKKFAATLIAEIARMAAIQAVWEAAQGLAMLALNFFWPDPKLAASAAAHFHAAAVYGGMAVLAAGAGRAVAGNDFQTATGGAGGGAGGGNQGRNPSDRGTPTREADRRGSSAGGSTLTINLGLKEGIVAEHFRRDYNLNGVTRLVIQTDGGS